MEQSKQGKTLQWMQNRSLRRPVEEKANEKLLDKRLSIIR